MSKSGAEKSSRLSRWISDTGPSRALTNGQTLGLFLAGATSTVVGIVAVFVTSSSDIAKTGLLIAGSVFLLFALLGRLPNRLSLGGWEVEFGKDQVKELLDLVKSEAPDIFEAVVEITRAGARDKAVIDEAVKAATENAADEQEAELKATRLDEGADSERNAKDVRITRNRAVLVPSRGRPPIVDALLEFPNFNVAVEWKNNWTPTIARTVSARLLRVLTSDEVRGAVLVLPAQYIRDANLQIDDQRVWVVSQFDADDVRKHFEGIN